MKKADVIDRSKRTREQPDTGGSCGFGAVKRYRPIFTAFLLTCCLLVSGCGDGSGLPGLDADGPETRSEPLSNAESVADTVSESSEDSAENASEWTVSSLAVRRFMEPLVQNAWVRPEGVKGDIRYVMLHFSSDVLENPDSPYDLERMIRIYTDSGASVHYVIDREGKIWCLIPEDLVSWHAGEGSWKDDPELKDRMSFHSIGIELLAIGSEKDMARYLKPEEYGTIPKEYIGYTEAQYASLKKLLEELCERYKLPADREHIIGHEEYAPDRKNDPGELFDWSKAMP